MPIPRILHLFLFVAIVVIAFVNPIAPQALAQDESDFITQLESFEVYGGKTEVVNGFTGEEYTSGNDVVRTIHANLARIMGGLHQKLLKYEIRHMNARLADAPDFEADLASLVEPFGIKRFKMDTANWFRIEKAILDRLHAKPFFQIKEIVVWERRDLSLSLEETKYSRNIRFNTETLNWERRALTEWKVNYINRNNGQFQGVRIKHQGLNLETHKGFHIMQTEGLGASIHPRSFKEVSLSYPIIYDSSIPAQTQIDKLNNEVIHNLRVLYDPFTWIARRETRFKGVYASTLRNYVEREKYKVTDREWFNRFLSNFLSDTVKLKRHGINTIYNDYVISNFDTSPNGLGYDLDLLNWNPDEKREGKGPRGRDKPIWITFDSHHGASLIFLDMYLRYGDKVIDTLREKLINLKNPVDPKALLKEVIKEVTGHSPTPYIKATIKAQKETIEQYRKKPRRF